MKAKKLAAYPTMSGSAIYRIRVRGHLGPENSDRFEGMHIEPLTRGNGTSETVLEGRLPDQAALKGVLNTLYELHLPVISTDCLGGSDETEDE